MLRISSALVLAFSLSGCIGTAVGVAKDVVVGTASIGVDVVVGTVDITTDVVGTAVDVVNPFGGSDDDESKDS